VTPEELADLLERRILGDPELTTAEVVAAGGTDLALAEELWTGLGFSPVDPARPTFTQADAEILGSLQALADLGIAGPEVVVPMTRVLGQALSRVANAQVHAFRRRLLEAAAAVDAPTGGAEGPVGPPVGEHADPAVARHAEEVLESVTDLLLPGFERFISYTWRRHLADAIRRELVTGDREGDVIGFADLVDYTRETRDLDDTDLSELLSLFQAVVYEQVTAVGGRIVKTLGDGIMFSVPVATGAARAALGIVEACGRDDRLPAVRVGVASGHLLALEGDLFGETVNRASRLCDLARPHTVLADDETGEALAASGEFTTKRLRPHKLKGLGPVASWVVRPPRI
jgi:adenylate cyclase